LLALAMAGYAIGAVGACNEPQAPPVGKPQPIDTAEQVGFGVRTLLTANGVQKGELHADTMFIYNDQTKFDFRNARVKFNTETGAPNGTIAISGVSGGDGSYSVVATDEDAIFETHVAARNGGDALTGNDDADEIEWVGSRYRDDFLGRGDFANCAE
jgi:hypothetical protein